MRFVLAISALVLSGILLILGIGQTTFLAGPRVISQSVQLQADQKLAVIDAEQLAAVPGQTNIVVSGVEPLVSLGQSRDVDAWVAPFAHEQLLAQPQVPGDRKKLELETERVSAQAEAAEQYATLIGAAEGDEIEVPSPRGSDLWFEERQPQTEIEETDEPSESEEAEARLVESMSVPVSLLEDQSLIVSAAAGDEPLDVAVEWRQDRRTPWAGPLLAAGGFFALVGAVLYLLAVDHDRRGLGPRRGRKGPLQGIRNVVSRPSAAAGTGKKRKGGEATAERTSLRRGLGIGALGVSAALLLTGCSPSYWPDFSPAPAETEAPTEAEQVQNLAPVPVTQAQIDRILADVAEVAGTADDNLDAAALAPRFTGDALESREQNYKIRKSVSDYVVVEPRITDEALGYQLVQSTEGWPRTVFVVVASQGQAGAEAEETPSLALVMTQAGPHENYLVSKSIALRGGITMPKAAPAEEGTALLADDITILMMTPAEVGPAYAAVLAGGTGVEQAQQFDLEGDTLVSRLGAAWLAGVKQKAAEGNQLVDHSVSAKQTDSPITTFSTGTGGALVVTTVEETHVAQSQSGTRWKLNPNPAQKALSGLEDGQEKLVDVIAHQLLFYVPKADSGEKIQLLGYTSDLVRSSN